MVTLVKHGRVTDLEVDKRLIGNERTSGNQTSLVCLPSLSFRRNVINVFG